jgi:hypothetical protein
VGPRWVLRGGTTAAALLASVALAGLVAAPSSALARRPDCQRVLILGAAWACHLVRGASQRSSSPPRHADPTGFTTATPPLTSFEVWADVAPHYHLDPHWTEIAGYSMGGYGTFKLTGQFPDLFAKDQPTVGTSADTSLVPSLRNIPVLMWNVATDELVPPSFYCRPRWPSTRRATATSWTSSPTATT